MARVWIFERSVSPFATFSECEAPVTAWLLRYLSAGPWHASQDTPSSARTMSLVEASDRLSIEWQERQRGAFVGSPISRLEAIFFESALWRVRYARACRS